MATSDDDLDRRFAELIETEFPGDRPVAASQRPRRRTPKPPAEPVTILDRFDAADEEEWDRGENRVRPPAPGPLRPWSVPAKFGTVLMALSFVLTLLIAFGVPLPAWMNTVAMVAFVVGLGVLLYRLISTGGPRRDDGDDGARL